MPHRVEGDLEIGLELEPDTTGEDRMGTTSHQWTPMG
jgi:hypothetical protein